MPRLAFAILLAMSTASVSAGALRAAESNPNEIAFALNHQVSVIAHLSGHVGRERGERRVHEIAAVVWHDLCGIKRDCRAENSYEIEITYSEDGKRQSCDVFLKLAGTMIQYGSPVYSCSTNGAVFRDTWEVYVTPGR